MEHLSSDGHEVAVGAKFWDSDLRVVEITEVAVSCNSFQENEVQTWHRTSHGQADTMSGRLQKYGRLARFFEGKDARDYPAGKAFGSA